MSLASHFPYQVVIQRDGTEAERIARDLQSNGGIKLGTGPRSVWGFRTAELRDEALVIVRALHGAESVAAAGQESSATPGGLT